MTSKNNKIKRIVCILLSVCIVSVPVCFSMAVSGTDSIESLEQQLKDLEQKNQEYQDILDKTQSEINQKESYNAALVSKIGVLDDKIAISHKKIDELNSDIEQKQADIDKANADIDGQMDALCNRIRTIYMAGNASDLEIILGAKDFSDFIDKMELIKTLSNYDKELIDDINVKLQVISKQKESLESDKSELEAQQNALEADQQELNTLLEENRATLRKLYSASDDAKNALQDAALQSDEIENQITEYYEEQRKEASQHQSSNQGGSSNIYDYGSSYSPNISASGYTWPAPGYYYLSSQWNEDRGSYNHGAIDIAGSGIMGAAAVAADSGTVISSYNGCAHNWGKDGSCGCGGGYGNYVMIDHGNGKMTVYGHFTNVIVSDGQRVSKGQVIGYIGSTGNSTGPHLHFECRLNGVKYNPMLEF